MIDLNELFLFAKVVEHGGFSPAGRALAMSKATLSRRVNQLETRLGVRLIQRSTRHFQVTEIGNAYYRQCVAMLAEADSAEEVISECCSEPRGVVRVSCTTPLLTYWVAPLLTRFMLQYPAVELYVKSFNRRVDIISEGYDLALNLCFPPIADSDMVMKILAQSPQVLVGSAALLTRVPVPRLPVDLNSLPSVAWGTDQHTHYSWQLHGANGESAQIRHFPCLISDDIGVLKNAVLDGLGIAILPQPAIAQELADGRLQRLLQHWQPAAGVITAAFPSRRGLLPSVRALIDFLEASIQQADIAVKAAQS
ncbi:LysR substrate-binding domain-containing protein [Pseudomonas putida]